MASAGAPLPLANGATPYEWLDATLGGRPNAAGANRGGGNVEGDPRREGVRWYARDRGREAICSDAVLMGDGPAETCFGTTPEAGMGSRAAWMVADATSWPVVGAVGTAVCTAVAGGLVKDIDSRTGESLVGSPGPGSSASCGDLDSTGVAPDCGESSWSTDGEVRIAMVGDTGSSVMVGKYAARSVIFFGLNGEV